MKFGKSEPLTKRRGWAFAKLQVRGATSGDKKKASHRPLRFYDSVGVWPL